MESFEDGMCSVYSAQPSETNCSISEALVMEMNGVNERAEDELSLRMGRSIHGNLSIYTALPSETNVTARESFIPCRDVQKLNISQYSAAKSETNVTMREKFLASREVEEVNHSIYSTPVSETNVTVGEKFEPCNAMYDLDKSEYTMPASEVDATMRDGFEACKVMQKMKDHMYGQEYTAVSEIFESTEIEQIQEQLGISDDYIFGMERSDGRILKVVDSVECLHRLNDFEPRPVDLAKVLLKPTSNFMSTMENPSVEGYLVNTPMHHEI